MAAYGVLGPLTATVEGVPVDLGGARGRAVLAVLLLARNTVVSVDRLIELVWGEDPPQTADAALQNQVSRLRRLLGPGAIETLAPGYLLRVPPGAVDIDEFDALVEQAGAATPPEAGGLLRRALGLWRGPALADLADQPFAQVEIARLEELRLGALEARIDADLGSGRHEVLAGELEALVAEHPYRERLHAQRMLALYRAGRQADALGAYHAARAALDEGLGIDPGPELQALEVRILQQDPVLAAPTGTGAPRSAKVLLPPAPLDPLIGRAAEIAAVEASLDVARLVTITGLGGMGKTRLALAVAERLGGAGWPVRFVDLSSVSAAADVPAAVASVLAVGDSAEVDLETAVATSLARERSLLVLDNLEHVLASRPFIAMLLEQAPGLRILATSRVRLELRGERELPLDPLPVPGTVSMLEASDAGRLFLRRAHERAALGELGLGDAEAIVEICRRMDGMPLALELAAAWTRILSPRAIARRLVEGRLELGTGVASRHSSLELVVASTVDLIGPEDREVFDILGLFAGGFGEAAAAVVIGVTDPLPALRRLEAVALVRAMTQPDGEPRFVMLETIRAIAARRLEGRADARAVRRRFVEHFAAQAQVAADGLRDLAPAGALSWMTREADNLHVAFEAAVALDDPPLAVQLAMTMATYGVRSGSVRRSLERLRVALELGPVPPGIRSEALCAVANLASQLDEGVDAGALIREAVDLARAAGDRRREARALVALGSIDPPPDAEQILEEAARMSLEIGYVWAATAAIDNQASMVLGEGRLSEAAALFERSIEVSAAAGDTYGDGYALANLAEIRANLGELAEATSAAERAVALLRVSWPDSTTLALALGTEAAVHALSGRQPEAFADLAEACRVALASESDAALADVLGCAATVLAAGHPNLAARTLGGRDRVAARMRSAPTAGPLLDRTAASLRQALGAERMDIEHHLGADMGAHACVASVLALVARG